MSKLARIIIIPTRFKNQNVQITNIAISFADWFSKLSLSNDPYFVTERSPIEFLKVYINILGNLGSS